MLVTMKVVKKTAMRIAASMKLKEL